MNILLLGNQEFILSCARAVKDSGWEIAALVSMPEAARPNNSVDCSSFAQENCIPYHEIEDVNSVEGLRIIQSYRPDYLLVSWPKLLKSEILAAAKFGVVGTHSTELPFNRGRHGLHWLIAMGISRSALTFFQMDIGIDTGNILLQIPIVIDKDDHVQDLMRKVNEAGYEGSRLLCQRLADNPELKGIPQDNGLSNSWRKRSPYDVTIDLRMSADQISRIVRSFSPPYPCANLIFENYVMKVSSVSIAKIMAGMDKAVLERIEPGKVLAVSEGLVQVKVDDAIIDLFIKTPIPMKLFKTKYIHPPLKYLSQNPLLLE